jgi:gluconolactonase
MRLVRAVAAIVAAAALAAPGASQSPAGFETIGLIERASPAFDRLVAPGARIERLTTGFGWSEGPLWIREGRYWLFSDVARNRIHRWTDADGLSVFLEPSGAAGPDLSAFREPGSNGLIRGADGSVLMADHGNRAIARLDLATRRKTLLATHYNGRRFNSPNDLVLARSGAIYFTDPPYGLAGIDRSPLKEQPHNGVYRLDPDGRVTLIDASLSFPNGVALSPDGHTLYVSNSDPSRAIWMAYTLDQEGNVVSRRIFADATDQATAQFPGLPDGMAVDRAGNLFATGPGGVWVFTPGGAMIGRIVTGAPVANCKFGEDGRSLFMTSGGMIARVRTRTRGLGF